MRCNNCETPAGAPEWEARETYLWANGHGYAVRVFCNHCGYMTDYKILYNRLPRDRFSVVRCEKMRVNENG